MGRGGQTTDVNSVPARRVSHVMADAASEKRELARAVDHTVLKAETTEDDVKALCAEARQFNTASVCVNGSRVTLAAAELAGSEVKVCSVIGFPLGAMSSQAKAAEAAQALSDGATEIDMVLNVGKLKDGDDEYVRSDIEAVRSAIGERGILKVIIESATLTDDEIVRACEASCQAGAEFVKTSTGFHSSGGATVEAVRLMKKTVGDRAKVKASGGIRTLADARAMREAGADRLGLSGTASILAELDGSEAEESSSSY
jgi:deoxyribose-phosphate aldolase